MTTPEPGDRVVLIGRSPDKTRRVAAETGGDGHVADFAELGQVRDLAAQLTRRHPRIDVLISNAGLIAGARRTMTADGHELTFQVNHLAPFLLTMLLHGPLGAGRQLRGPARLQGEQAGERAFHP